MLCYQQSGHTVNPFIMWPVFVADVMHTDWPIVGHYSLVMQVISVQCASFKLRRIQGSLTLGRCLIKVRQFYNYGLSFKSNNILTIDELKLLGVTIDNKVSSLFLHILNWFLVKFMQRWLPCAELEILFTAIPH